MTTEQVERVPLNYCPEGYAAHLNHVLGWAEGSTKESVREAEREVTRALIRVAEAYGAGDTTRAEVLAGQLLPNVPGGLAPALFFEAVAEQMALPIWESYTAEQRERGYRYAARYVSHRLKKWLGPKIRPAVGPEPEKWDWEEVPRGAYLAFMEERTGRTQLRMWLTQVHAYLDTHPGGEADLDRLRELMARWGDCCAPQAFF